MIEAGTESAVRTIQQRYSEAWNSHDRDAVAALHTDDTRFCTHGAGPTAEGRDSMRAAAAQTFAQFRYLLDFAQLQVAMAAIAAG